MYPPPRNRGRVLSKLLLLPLLLLVLKLAASPVLAAEVTITIPLRDNDIHSGLVNIAWRVDPTQPMETWDGIAKAEYWVDGVLKHSEEYPHPPDPNAKGPLSIMNWTYDGRKDGETATHEFVIKAWIWKQTWVYFPFPPTITWQQLATLEEDTTQSLYNCAPGVKLDYDPDDNAGTLGVSGRVYPASCAVEVNSEPVQVGSVGDFTTTMSLSEGPNSIEIIVTDPATELTWSTIQNYYRASVSATASGSILDCDSAASVSLQYSPAAAATCVIQVWDVDRSQVVKTLAVDDCYAGQNLSTAWDGSADTDYPYVCANGKVVPGGYALHVYTMAPAVPGSELRAVKRVASLPVTVSNSAAPPAWSEAEAEALPTNAFTGAWSSVIGQRLGGGAAVACSVMESTATLAATISGTRVDIVYVTTPDGAEAEVKIDGVSKTTFSLASADDAGHPGQVVTVNGLDPGTHALLITVTRVDESHIAAVIDALRTY